MFGRSLRFSAKDRLANSVGKDVLSRAADATVELGLVYPQSLSQDTIGVHSIRSVVAFCAPHRHESPLVARYSCTSDWNWAVLFTGFVEDVGVAVALGAEMGALIDGAVVGAVEGCSGSGVVGGFVGVMVWDLIGTAVGDNVGDSEALPCRRGRTSIGTTYHSAVVSETSQMHSVCRSQ